MAAVLLFAALLHSAPGTALAQTQPAGTLSGVVRGTEGNPIAGAKVILQAVITQTPVGQAEVNSYEAGKDTVTSADGRFAFGGLRGDAFDLAVVVDGYRGVRMPGVSPGAPLEVRLEREDLSVPPTQRIRIRLIDESDAPVVGARLRVEAVYDLRNRSRPGETDLVDLEGLSDPGGEIELVTRLPRVGVGGWITARGMVAELISAYPSGVQGREGFELTDERGAYSVMRMSRGFPASGTLWTRPDNPSEGRPLPGQVVEIVRVTSNPRHVDRVRVLTGEDGRFEFPQVAAHLSFRYYGVLGQPGATLVSDLTVDPESLEADRALDVGALLCPPTIRIAGRVVLEGGLKGETIEPGTKLRLKRARGWDSVVAEVGPGGEFLFAHIPQGLVAEISLEGVNPADGSRSGLILSGDQNGYDVLTDSVVGMVEDAAGGLEIRVRRGRRLPLSGLTSELTAELREQRERLESLPLGKTSTPTSPPPSPATRENPAP